MNIIVCSRVEVPEKIREHKITHCLTLIGPRTDVNVVNYAVQENNVNWKLVLFDDINIPANNYIHPTEDHAKEILEWFETLPENANVLIHCEAGISRSTACALALLVKNNGNDEWSIKNSRNELLKIRPIALPNRLLTRHFDKLLECNGNLNKTVNYIHSQPPEDGFIRF